MRSVKETCGIILPIALTKRLIMAEMDRYSRNRIIRRIRRDNISQIIFVNPNFNNDFLILLTSLEKLDKEIVIISNRINEPEGQRVIAFLRAKSIASLFLGTEIFILLKQVQTKISFDQELVITNFWPVSVIIGLRILNIEYPLKAGDESLIQQSPLPTDKISVSARKLFYFIRKSLDGRELSANRSREFKKLL